MHDDGVSSPPPDDFAEAPRVSYAEPAAGSAASVPPTRPPALRKAPAKRKPAKPAKKKAAKGKKKGSAAKKRPAAKKRSGKKKSA